MSGISTKRQQFWCWIFQPAVTQAIALFLERQSDVQYADELLNMLDQNATPIDIFVQAVRDVVGQLMGWFLSHQA